MTKLEEKLIELGYTRDEYNSYVYYKDFTRLIGISVNIELKITGTVWICHNAFNSQKQIDNLQQAFNQLQKDLEELRKYEEKEN